MQSYKTYIIRKISDGTMFRAISGKTCWRQPGHAKLAWNNSMRSWTLDQYGVTLVTKEEDHWCKINRKIIFGPVEKFPKFSEQDVWEIIELKSKEIGQLDEAVELLKECQNHVEYSMYHKIDAFLESVK